VFHAPNPAYGAAVTVYLKSPPAQPVAVTITDNSGKVQATLLKDAKEAGLYRLNWNLRGDGDAQVAPGEYTATFKAGEQTLTKKFRVEKPETAE
jgi:flagellar hook assembly protein FlgD